MQQIELEEMLFFARHGCYREERLTGNRFSVDLRLETNLMPALHSDNIERALNYVEAYEIVKREMAIPSNLLEHVAGRILKSLFLHFLQLEKATVKISKWNPPIGGQTQRVSVTISQTRVDRQSEMR